MAEETVLRRVTDRMRALCSKREYCSSEIKKKLNDVLEGDNEAVAGILDSLKKDGYVDDSRYASAFARDKSSIAGWGNIKIRHALAAKGVERDVVEAALKEIDPEKADSRLEKLAANRYKALKDDPQCRLKMLRYLLGRGYSYDEVSSVTELLMKRYEEF
ncbi:MAG: RecX family transcriptional regulator [Bacteroidales bacterium]|nr:RecX family transcriptional regulator [Bacteroidales bacterium]